ncbi:MAG: YdcF family protein [Spirochaetia bacterium]|nr:YdcF family protein [Spirochaetia bacterium]
MNILKMFPTVLQKFRKKIINIFIYCFSATLVIILVSNWIIISSTRHLIAENLEKVKKADVGIILGAAVYSGNRVSTVVGDRIESAIELYREGKVDKLLISGDHAERYYDEVNTIKFWLLKNGIPPGNIEMDPSGFSTYESMCRARNVFNVNSAVIITQSYHLPRALYLARRLGISAQGFGADQRLYKNAKRFLMREYLARAKDFIYIHILKPK